jgi:hypothetical protein
VNGTLAADARALVASGQRDASRPTLRPARTDLVDFILS